MSTNPVIYQFHGGMQLEHHKQLSLGQPLQQASLADEIIIPLNQHIGEANQALVKVGDEVSAGQILAETSELVSAPVHAPCTGRITAIEPRPIAHPSGQQADCFILQPTAGLATIESWDNPPLADSSKQELLEIIRAAGIVGLGGAVFPTAAKLETADNYPIETLIINGAECEPYITCDDILMQTRPALVIRGIQYLQRILQPQRTLIGIEDNKPTAIKAMREALSEAALEHTEVVSIPSLYPSGSEKQLIKILTGQEVHSGQLAFEIGALSQNTGTCAAIAQAVDQNQALTSRIVTVTGPGVNNPGNWLTPLGTPFSHLIELAGGYKVAQPKLIMGGPMMGLELNDDRIPVVKATNCILVLDQADQPQAQPCVRCGRCTEVCPAKLLPQQLYWYSRARQFETMEKYHLFDCIECGCCSAVCPSHIPLVQYYRYAKSEIWEQQRKTYKSDRSRKRHEFREARLERQKQRDEERRRLKREALAKKKAAQQQTGDKPDKPKEQTVDAVQAALLRVKARKQQQDAERKNISNLTPEQQRQIDEADARRQKMKQEDS
ncbi:MAG: electron transport complex subunit RsxC [Gammaproteobacteria bacterium]|nr:electron transport complex subunit RsxC [Gammaproteobacteria bacterium]